MLLNFNLVICFADMQDSAGLRVCTAQLAHENN